MVWLILVALASGLLGGMGMGGGTLYIPALTLLFGVPQRLAQWLNLISFVPMAAIALAIHAKNKRLELRAFLTLFVPALFSAIGCAFLATKIQSRWLSLLFGCFLLILGSWGFVFSLCKGIAKWRKDTPKEPKDD